MNIFNNWHFALFGIGLAGLVVWTVMVKTFVPQMIATWLFISWYLVLMFKLPVDKTVPEVNNEIQ